MGEDIKVELPERIEFACWCGYREYFRKSTSVICPICHQLMMDVGEEIERRDSPYNSTKEVK